MDLLYALWQLGRSLVFVGMAHPLVWKIPPSNQWRMSGIDGWDMVYASLRILWQILPLPWNQLRVNAVVYRWPRKLNRSVLACRDSCGNKLRPSRYACSAHRLF